jgi:TatD DNase family protein
MSFIDSHCHLNSFEDLDDVLDSARNSCVTKIVSIGTEFEDFFILNEIAKKNNKFIDITIGIHPDNCLNISRETFLEYINDAFDLDTEKKIIGIGEIGLDYRDGVCDNVKEKQIEIFEAQLDFASKKNLPVCIHMRNSAEDVISIIKNFQNIKGVFHCFCEDKVFAKRVLDFDFLISFSGIVTFKNAKTVQETAQYVPIEKILLETDAPFLAPTPNRGKRNEPAFVSFVYDFVAQLRGVQTCYISENIFENFNNLFHKG